MTRHLRSLVAVLVAFWSTVAGFAADVVINPAQTFQMIEGWGHGSGIISGTLGPYGLLGATTADPVNYQYLDCLLNDLGLTGSRIWEVGPRIDGTGNDHGDCDVIDWNLFESDTFPAWQAAYLVYCQNRILAEGYQPSFYSSPTYPSFASQLKPWVMNHPGERAQQIWASALYLKNTYGVNTKYGVILNEPSVSSTILTDDIYALGPRFVAQGLSTVVQYAEAVAPQNDWNYMTPVLNDVGLWPYIGRISYHNYGTADPYRSYLRELAGAKGLTTAQTEMGNPTFDDLYNDLTLGGVSYWEVAFSASNTLASNPGLTSFAPSGTYFRLRQLMHYVRPGAVRIATASSDGNVRVLAFAQNGAVTTIIENNASSAQTVNLNGLPPGLYGLSSAPSGGTSFQEFGTRTVGANGTLTLSNVAGGSAVTTLYPTTATNHPPTIEVWGSNPGYLVAPASTATLSVTANDADLDALTYAWSVNSQPTGANAILATPAAATTNVSGLTAPGTYIFNVSVSDGVNVVSRQVYLVVYASAPPPVLGQVGFRLAAPYGLVFAETGTMTHAVVELPTSSMTLQAGISDIPNSDFTGRGTWTLVSQPAGASASVGSTTYIFVSLRANVSGMTVPGDYVFQINVTNPGQPDLTAQIICTVNPASSPPVINSLTASSPSITLPTSSLQLSATTSGSAGVTLRQWWVVKSAPVGAAPAFDHQGALTTTVSNLVLPGSYTFTLRAFDDVHMTTMDTTITVGAATGAPVVTSPATASVIAGAPLNYTIAASNSPNSFNASGLPSGMSVDTGSGAIMGTPATTGTYDIQISATSGSGTGYGNLQLTVMLPNPAITSAPVADGLLNSAFFYTATTTNVATSFAATGLPNGLVLDTIAGNISGTPTVAGIFSATISATNTTGTVSAPLTIVIYTGATPAPVITSPPTAAGTTQASFNYWITATNNPTSYFAIGLPAGLTFDPGAGAISGTPLITGTFNVTIRATNRGGTGSATLTLTINNGAPQAPAIGSSLTANGAIGTAFNYSIWATNSPLSFNATSLPSGLTLNTTNGVISGVPSVAGTFNVGLGATNAQGTGTAALTLTISASGPPVITSATTAIGTMGTGFNYAIVATSSPTSYGATGLPSGLSLNTTTGLISGIPTTPGTANVTLSATNANGTNTANLTLTVNNAATTGLVGYWKLDDGSSTTALDSSGNGNQGTLVNGPVWTTGMVGGALSFSGSNPYVNVPDNATLHPDIVTLSAWINSQNPSSSSQQAIIAKDDGVQRAFNLKITGGTIQFTISNGSTSKAISGVTALQANTWYYVAGVYDGASLLVYVNGVLEGSVSLTLASGWDNTQALSIGGRIGTNPSTPFNGILDEVRMYGRALTVSEIQALALPTPAITSSLNLGGAVGAPFSYDITATNTPTSFSATGLPTGLTFDPATGIISGTLQAVGATSISLGASNADGTGSATLTLTVNPSVPVPAWASAMAAVAVAILGLRLLPKKRRDPKSRPSLDRCQP